MRGTQFANMRSYSISEVWVSGANPEDTLFFDMFTLTKAQFPVFTKYVDLELSLNKQIKT